MEWWRKAGARRSVLWTLEESGPLTEQDLVRALRRHPGDVGRLLPRMRREGLIAKTQTPMSARVSDGQILPESWTPTEAGRAVAAEARKEQLARRSSAEHG